MASQSSTITVLLMLEAIDKASSILEGIGGKLQGMGQAAQDAAAKAALTGEELEAAQLRAEAATNAYAAAVDEQTKAQAQLVASTDAVRAAQAAQEQMAAQLATAVEAGAQQSSEAYKMIAAAADAAAADVKTAVAEQVAALDALKDAEDEVAGRSEEMAAAQAAANTKIDASGIALGGLKTASMVSAAAVAGIGFESLKAASSFQSATTVLVTSGGETAANIGMVRQGILGLAASTGTATQQLTNGMYMIGSAGYTGQAGLNALKAAAQGAKAENADLSTVSNALTTVLHDYGVTATQVAGNQTLANAAMNQMITVVQNGKTTTEALAGSLSNVLPLASAVHLSFAQVGGAMATMTAQGMSADQSSQDLANTIRNLANPTNVATQEMMQFGINSTTVSSQLGSKGLTGTLAELTDAITSRMGPDGKILLSTFQNAQAAAADAKQEISALPANLQTLANAFLSGSITAKQWRTDLQGLSPIDQNLMNEFASTADKANSFNHMLTSGQYGAQTYTAALSKMLGGATGLNTALMLTGSNLATFQSNVNAVAAAGSNAGTSVEGWDQIQGNMNQKLAELKETVSAAAIQIGTALLPMVTRVLDVVMKVLGPIATWIEHNKTLAAVILLVVGALGAGILVFVAAAKAIEAVGAAMKVFGAITGSLEFNPVIAAITALAIVAILIITHWSTVKAWLADFWTWLKGAAADVAAFFTHVWDEIAKPLADAWTKVISFLQGLWSGIQGIWNATGGKVVTAVAHAWDEVAGVFSREWDHISKDLASIWNSLVTIWNATGGALVSLIADNWSSIEGVFEDAVHFIEDLLMPGFDLWVGIARASMAMLEALLRAAWAAITGAAKIAWNLLSAVIKTAWDLISGLVMGGVRFITGLLQAAWDVIVGAVKIVWDVITGIFNAALDTITGVLKMFADLFTGNWGKLWDDAKSLVSSVWNDIAGMFEKVLGQIGSTVASAASSIWKGFIGAIEDAISGVVNALKDVWNGITGFFSGAVSWLYDIGKNIVQGLINGVEDMVGGAVKAVKQFGSDVIGAAKDVLSIFSPSQEFAEIGHLTIAGFVKGIQDAAPTLNDAMSKAAGSIVGPNITASLTADARSTGSALVASAASGVGGAAAAGVRGGGVNVAFNFPNSVIAGPQSANWLMQQLNNEFVQKVLPTAGATVRRNTT